MSRREIARAARFLTEHYGPDAILRATETLVWAIDTGDADGAADWMRIIRTVDQRQGHASHAA